MLGWTNIAMLVENEGKIFLYKAAYQSKNWTVYKNALRSYNNNKELAEAKSLTWRSFCESFEKTSEAARLRKV